jgi:hypothetical protein
VPACFVEKEGAIATDIEHGRGQLDEPEKIGDEGELLGETRPPPTFGGEMRSAIPLCGEFLAREGVIAPIVGVLIRLVWSLGIHHQAARAAAPKRNAA